MQEAQADAAATVPIRLRTSLPGCSIPYVPYMVPVNWRRSQLSTLVNKVLQTADSDRKNVPFDFIANGELLRTSLDEYLMQHARSTEEEIELEYVRSTLPPTFRDSAKQDDWVSAIDASEPTLVLQSSFDGNVRVLNAEKLAKSPKTYVPAYARSSMSLTSARWLVPKESVVTGAMNGNVAVWHAPKSSEETVQVLQAAELRHHTGPVTNVDVGSTNNELVTVLSAGWDGCIAIWDVPRNLDYPTNAESSTHTEKPRKRRLQNSGKKESISAAVETIQAPPPTLVFAQVPTTVHASAAKALGTKQVAGANARTTARLDGDQVYGAAWDGSVKLFDMSKGMAAGEKTSDKVHLCLDVMRGQATHAQAITGHMDHSLGLYDFRDTTRHTALAIAHAHGAPISAIRSHPDSSNLFASGAYDSRIRVWDVRSPKQALFTLSQPRDVSGDSQKENAKILALDWTMDGNSIVAGGEDCRISVYQGSDIGKEHI
ncbi:ribosome biogenesis protein ytm1 [Malassezia yamatoensis]|uniref:Ribosome biogenesis protein ytm1 n=1 Tax=Malassezia yamatoensis TaxID=253288 RepID=A0AAJ5YQX7_9BASI|nr:ribosome biogenesis protein ytm1 [Malassezia yamatoensis]